MNPADYASFAAIRAVPTNSPASIDLFMHRLNLKRDYQTVLKHLTSRVKEYHIYENMGPGEDEDDVSLVTLGYSFEQSGWYALVFDTRPDATPDGEWQSYILENGVEKPDWCVDDAESLDVTHYNARWNEPKKFDDTAIAALLGNMMCDVLMEARKNGVLQQLPLAANCCVCVEEHEGRFGWPDYDELRTSGRAIM